MVNYNDYLHTYSLIKQLLNFSIIDEIVVVDSGSTDCSLTKLKSINNITVLETENQGYSHALNVGSKYLNNKYKNINIIESNSDISITDETVIIELNKMIDNKTKVVMAAVNENNTIKYGWRIRNKYIDLINSIPFINRLYNSKFVLYHKNYFNNIVNVDAIYGCFFLIDGQALEEIGYFDENVFLYFEENILFHKLKKAGYISKCNCNVSVSHLQNATIGSNVSLLNKYKIYSKSKMYYEYKYNNARISLIFFKLFYFINLIPYKIKALMHNKK